MIDDERFATCDLSGTNQTSLIPPRPSCIVLPSVYLFKIPCTPPPKLFIAFSRTEPEGVWGWSCKCCKKPEQHCISNPRIRSCDNELTRWIERNPLPLNKTIDQPQRTRPPAINHIVVPGQPSHVDLNAIQNKAGINGVKPSPDHSWLRLIFVEDGPT